MQKITSRWFLAETIHQVYRVQRKLKNIKKWSKRLSDLSKFDVMWQNNVIWHKLKGSQIEAWPNFSFVNEVTPLCWSQNNRQGAHFQILSEIIRKVNKLTDRHGKFAGTEYAPIQSNPIQAFMRVSREDVNGVKIYRGLWKETTASINQFTSAKTKGQQNQNQRPILNEAKLRTWRYWRARSAVSPTISINSSTACSFPPSDRFPSIAAAPS